MKNRILSLLIVLSLVIGLIAIPTVNAQETKYDSSIELLSALNILNYDKYGNYPAEIYTSRAQFAATVSNALKLNVSTELKGIFSDVTEETEYAHEIEALYEAGYVSGDRNKSFRPLDYITLNEAVKVLVSALGYSVMAEATGGYPIGYLNIARKLDVLTNVPSEIHMTNGSVAQLVRKTLDAPTCETVSMTKEGYTIDSTGETLFYLVHNIRKKSAVFNSDEYSSLVNPGSENLTGVTIGDEVFLYDAQNKDKFLGYYVNAYYDDDFKRIVHCEIDTKNNSLIISSNENPVYSNGILSYVNAETNKTRTEKIPATAFIIYNGKNITNFSPDKFSVKTGRIELVDNDRDKKWDVVKIYDYTTYIVDSLDYSNDRLYVKNAANPVISLSGVDCEFFDGLDKVSDYSYVTPWNVVSVLISDDGKLMRFYRSTDIQEMKIIEIGEDYVVGSDGIEYNVSQCYYEYYDEIKLGEQDTFLIDVFGNICGKITGLRRKGEIAYMLETEYNRVEKAAYFAVLNDKSTKDEKWVVIKSDKKIKIDGEKFKPNEAVLAIEDLLSSSTEKLVMLYYDSEGRVLEIDTLNMSSKEEPNNSLCLDHTEAAGEEGTGLLYREQSGTFGGKTIMAKDFKVFHIPPHAQGETPDESGLAVRDMRSLASGEYYNNFSTYKIGEDNLECVAMIRNVGATERLGSFDTHMKLSMIDSILNVRNPETEEFEKVIKYHHMGETGKAFLADQTIADELESGDIVKLSFDTEGKINAYKMVFDIGSRTLGSDYISSNFDFVSRAVLVNVYAVRDGIVLVTEEDPSELEALAIDALNLEGKEVTPKNIQQKVYGMCEKHRLPGIIGEYDLSKPIEERYTPSGEMAVRSYEEYGSDYSKMLLYSVYSTAYNAYILVNFD